MAVEEKKKNKVRTKEKTPPLRYAAEIGSAAGKNELAPLDSALPAQLLILPVLSMPFYPGILAPFIVTDQKTIQAIDEHLKESDFVGLILVKEGYPGPGIREEDLYQAGVAARVLKKIKLPDGSIHLLVHGLSRFAIQETLSTLPSLVAKVDYKKDVYQKDNETEALLRSLLAQVKALSQISPFFTDEMKLALLNAPNPGSITDLIAFPLNLRPKDAQVLIEETEVKKRAKHLLLHLKHERELADLQVKIEEDVNTKLNTIQREFFLKEQLKAIKKELGVEETSLEQETAEFKAKIEILPEEPKKQALSELERMQTLSEQSPEYSVSRNWLEWVVDLPWTVSTNDRVDLAESRRVLDRDHYGLERIKERVLEFLAVKKLKPTYEGSILCLVGPPGVGKTSLGRSIADSLGRKFYRFSLGGMRDEAEIKGHRRTYIGAMPGKIVQGLKRVGVNNPVILLDEIDKMGSSYQGDPASALLEVLDPEQNAHFLDHYIDLPFDLSKVLFIATANYLEEIPEALLDRMEVIENPGYSFEEKLEIVKKYVIPKQLEKHGLSKKDLTLGAPLLKKIIESYAREPGMRTLEQQIAKICRKVAKQKVEFPRKKLMRVDPAKLEELLGPARFSKEKLEKLDRPGMVNGLAWTRLGGDTLIIEAVDVPGNGGLKVTGQLGDVMKESTQIAYSYVKHCAIAEGLKPAKWFDENQVHIHIPAGAVPKDGPSAGITLAVALLSLLKNKKVRQGYAMTGELSLAGKVLPVGGIKEKILAAKRAGIKRLILPKGNERDLREIPRAHLKGLRFSFVTHVDQVFQILL